MLSLQPALSARPTQAPVVRNRPKKLGGCWEPAFAGTTSEQLVEADLIAEAAAEGIVPAVAPPTVRCPACARRTWHRPAAPNTLDARRLIPIGPRAARRHRDAARRGARCHRHHAHRSERDRLGRRNENGTAAGARGATATPRIGRIVKVKLTPSASASTAARLSTLSSWRLHWAVAQSRPRGNPREGTPVLRAARIRRVNARPLKGLEKLPIR